MLVTAVAVSGSSSAAIRLPTLFGQVRPATWANGDGSFLAAGLDGDGHKTFGHIRWVRWTTTDALGWAFGWERRPRPCALTPTGCPTNDPFYFKLASKRPF